MFKIILADDNPLIRMGMKSMIRWDDLKAQLIGEAEDGDEALELIRNHKADLLITDIRMPGKDGLYLIHEINDHYPDMSTIIISAYNEFAYAKEALKAGSVDYILKPIDPEEMNAAIRKAINRQKEHETEYFGMNIATIPAIIVLKTKEPYTPQEILMLLDRFSDIYVGKNKDVLVISFDANTYSVDRIMELLKKEIKGKSLLGKAIGTEKETREELLSNAKEDACRSFLKDAESKRCEGNLEEKQFNIDMMLMLCKSGNSEKAKEFYIQNQQRTVRTSAGNIEVWEKNTERFVGLLLSLDTETDCGVQDILRKIGSQKEELSYINHDELDWEIEICIEKLCKCFEGNKGSKNEIVTSVQEYIKQCYGEDLSLASIADTFHISAPYLSKIFKEKSGQNLNQFITETRMEKARYLLENSDRKIVDIAEMVGYEDVNYFIKVYKKVTGKTPAQGRKL